MPDANKQRKRAGEQESERASERAGERPVANGASLPASFSPAMARKGCRAQACELEEDVDPSELFA